MSVDKYNPHILILPEDDANNDILNGFLLEPGINNRKLQPLEVAGGWTVVRDTFVNEHIKQMRRLPERLMVLLVDFDSRDDRLTQMRKAIPDDLLDRVFVLGARKEPEDLKKARLGSFETIGLLLGRDCVDGTDLGWSHDLLRHNLEELKRLRVRVQSFLFLQV